QLRIGGKHAHDLSGVVSPEEKVGDHDIRPYGRQALTRGSNGSHRLDAVPFVLQQLAHEEQKGGVVVDHEDGAGPSGHRRTLSKPSSLADRMQPVRLRFCRYGALKASSDKIGPRRVFSAVAGRTGSSPAPA